jgi:hypothetical protein
VILIWKGWVAADVVISITLETIAEDFVPRLLQTS